MRLVSPIALAAALALTGAARAQAPATPAIPAPVPAAAGQPAPGQAAAGQKQAEKPNPVVARVNGEDIRQSDLAELARSLPQEYHQMPPQLLYPMLQEQAIDGRALLALAHKEGLDKDPVVQAQMQRAADQALQSAVVGRAVSPTVTDAAVKARYDQEVAGKAGEQEVHARHILVGSEDEAKKIIAELKAGGDFAKIAKEKSTDPGAAQGGDLGWFKKGDMVPEFADAAFAMKPGQISDTPVHTQFGWHVIQVLEVRQAPPPSFDQARDQLRQKMIQDGVQKVLADARSGVTIEKFNLDGSKPTEDAAAPAAGAAPAPAPSPVKK